jgi:hypothetical protein
MWVLKLFEELIVKRANAFIIVSLSCVESHFLVFGVGLYPN